MPGDSTDPPAWLRYADSDIGFAKLSLEKGPVYPEIICYHAQQCAEKCLKGFLVSRGLSYPKTHEIGVLVHLCMNVDDGFRKCMDAGNRLQVYAAKARYPTQDVVTPTHADAKRAVDDAEMILAFVRERIGR